MSSLEARRVSPQGVQVHTVGRGVLPSVQTCLNTGDVITSVDGKPIRNLKDLGNQSQIDKRKNSTCSVLIEFERNLGKYLTIVKIGPESDESQPLEHGNWLGISSQVLTKELSTNWDYLPVLEESVLTVFPETPAEKGGLVAGDLLFRIDGQIIAANRPEDSEVFGNMIKQYKTDSTILLSGMRDGKPIDMNITLSKQPPSNELPKLKDKKFEFTIREISFADRVNARLEIDHGGLVVETVEPAGWAALAGLRQGDLLLGIDQVSINTILDYQEFD